jgi:hypothetical protein
VCAIKTDPIANDGERRARRSSPTTVELAAPPQSKRKEKVAIIKFIIET